MSEMILYSSTLPMPIFQLISTEKIKVRKDKGEIRLIPIVESEKTASNCPFLGMYTDGKLTVDGFLERKRADKELEF